MARRRHLSGWPAWLAVAGIVLLSAFVGGFVVLKYAQPCVCIVSVPKTIT